MWYADIRLKIIHFIYLSVSLNVFSLSFADVPFLADCEKILFMVTQFKKEHITSGVASGWRRYALGNMLIPLSILLAGKYFFLSWGSGNKFFGVFFFLMFGRRELTNSASASDSRISPYATPYDVFIHKQNHKILLLYSHYSFPISVWKMWHEFLLNTLLPLYYFFVAESHTVSLLLVFLNCLLSIPTDPTKEICLHQWLLLLQLTC